MTEPITEPLVVTRITLERHIDADGGDDIFAVYEDANGDMPGLVEILGMLEMAKDTAIRAAMGEIDGDDE